MAHIESQAYRDGSSEEDFMEEAGSGVALIAHDFVERNNLDRHVVLLCGKGNNAGDAYVAGIHLLHLDYQVFALQTSPINECSSLCQKNYHRFLIEGGHSQDVNAVEEIALPMNGIIIDGLFGTGFHGSLQEPVASIVRLVNHSHLPIIAVDIPSGLDGATGNVEGEAIMASETAFLGLPKTGFFLQEGWNHVGKLRYVDFGLPQEYIEESDADLFMLEPTMLKFLLPPVKRNRHKYEAGYVVSLAGSPSMPGAAMLSSLAALRGGAGIVRLLHPDGMQPQLSSSPYELIKTPYQYQDPEAVIQAMNRASATLIGPGIGLTAEVRRLLQAVLPSLTKPCVIDADALTILSEEDIALPEHVIMTPHMGEMLRLLKLTSPQPIDMDFLKICQHFAEDRKVTLVLKGGPSFIFHAGETMRVNPSGTPGMATAGSGDVLTGFLAALLAQGLSTHNAASLGVYLHGLAGEHAAAEYSMHCMIASDIISYFPEAFHFIEI